MPRSREMLHVVHKRPQEFAKIEDAIAAMRAGEMVIVADDEDRENEGDLTSDLGASVRRNNGQHPQFAALRIHDSFPNRHTHIRTWL